MYSVKHSSCLQYLIGTVPHMTSTADEEE